MWKHNAYIICCLSVCLVSMLRTEAPQKIQAPFALSFAVARPVCAGGADGSLTASTIGGVPPFQFSQDGGKTYGQSTIFKGLKSGTYDIAAKDAQGTVSRSRIQVTEPPMLALSVASNPGGEVNLTATGGTPPYVYSSDGGKTFNPEGRFKALQTGKLTFVAKDAYGCTVSVTSTIQNQKK